MTAFLEGLVDPHFVLGHFPYFLLCLSMLMRRMVWLRVIAIAAGLSRIFYRTVLVFDPVSVLWETILVIINVGQLLITWWYARHHRFSTDEQNLLERLAPDADRRALRRLFGLGAWRHVPAGTALTVEGEHVNELIFLADGLVRIEKGGAIVAVCGAGDFIGEMSFITGRAATATSIADRQSRLLAFRQSDLRKAAEDDAAVRHILETAFNRNLIDKLSKSGDTTVGTSSAPYATP